jgi:hypothetical protein
MTSISEIAVVFLVLSAIPNGRLFQTASSAKAAFLSKPVKDYRDTEDDISDALRSFA